MEDSFSDLKPVIDVIGDLVRSSIPVLNKWLPAERLGNIVLFLAVCLACGILFLLVQSIKALPWRRVSSHFSGAPVLWASSFRTALIFSILLFGTIMAVDYGPFLAIEILVFIIRSLHHWYSVPIFVFAGAFFYGLRSRFIFWYGLFEVFVGFLGIAVTSKQPLVGDQTQELARLLAVLSSVYIMVRGFDNMDKGPVPYSWRRWWQILRWGAP